LHKAALRPLAEEALGPPALDCLGCIIDQLFPVVFRILVRQQAELSMAVLLWLEPTSSQRFLDGFDRVASVQAAVIILARSAAA
jgi:hypothetical protein